MPEGQGLLDLKRVKALIPFREALGEIREGWRRARYRRALERRELVVPSEGIHLSYGDVHPRAAEGTMRGGRVKLLHLQEAFPANDRCFNILYLVSSAQPRFGEELARWAKARGVRMIWNQNGVAYPAWAGRSYRRVNARMRAMMEQADYIIYQSEFCRESADRYLGRALAPSEVLYNCVDTERFRPAEEALPTEPWVLLIAGTHQQPERVLSALETAAILKRRNRRVRLIVAGLLDWVRGEDEVRLWIQRLGIGGEVELAGQYTQEDAPGLCRRAHILLHPKYKDPSPTVPIEAMACGVPVVGSRSGGMPELVGEDGGILVEVPESWEEMHAPDAERMADAVAEIMGDWWAWRARARKRVEGRYGKERWVSRHAAIFRALLAGER